ncbi:MAG TPA: class I SAM-dependent methyltransferase [Adlercreutzia equolifaciens]|uniref:class I SAM-dependent methyltransferase n=1 Tax=Adlercreutzia equolifaciens TaxID=446660 RepID=UPI002431FC61|nr:methyltransferase domain-containing protein [Adlercreutzia equolifaciens]HJI11995.1 class I SAM-dependent methyltransferase [Adlercreutzia equolifaciens]
MECDTLRRHYESLSCEGGFESRCHMELPERSLVGARIVNVGCRRGKGTYKLSEQVGEGGFVVGVDWNEAFVEAARADVPRALERSGFTRCNMAFRVGFPEDLAAAGIEDGWADFVYLNSSLSLFASPSRALEECCRVLAPGGVLLAEVPVAVPGGADRAAVVAAARALPNAVQAAPTFEELFAWLAAAGFAEPVVGDERPLAPEEGSAPDRPVPTVPGDDATYRLLSLEGAR